MNEEPTTPPAAPAEGQNCGCTCEHCMAGNHGQCQSGTCTVKTPQGNEGQS